jgi:aminoglycoside/choline kinase family phosphotransferase
MTDRATLVRKFLSGTDWAGIEPVSLAGDASNRRYDRLIRDGDSVVLMDAPPEKGEDVRPFVRIAQFLSENGLSAPKILHQDAENGFLLLEDLGDGLFARVAQSDPETEPQLYTAATDVLVQLHRVSPPALAPYSAEVMTKMAALAWDWYRKGISGQADAQAFTDAFLPILRAHAGDQTVLIQRDYHAENLLWLPDRAGVARVGLLDFQDAMTGHPAYDLVSLLKDARRDVSADLEQQMIAHYVSETGSDPAEFQSAYQVLGVQRNLRILGVFARLCLRDTKPSYVDLIPRVWRHLQNGLAHPALTPVAPLIQDLPEPTPENLQRLKDQAGCAQGQ